MRAPRLAAVVASLRAFAGLCAAVGGLGAGRTDSEGREGHDLYVSLPVVLLAQDEVAVLHLGHLETVVVAACCFDVAQPYCSLPSPSKPRRAARPRAQKPRW